MLALLLAVFAVYQPAWHGSPVWDDDAHMTRPELQSADGLRRIWFDPGATQQYYPLVHSTFWLLYRLWGANTFPYHLLNILLHALSAILLALALRRLRVPAPWLAAAVFAIHPVHVESVAWISELKNTLSGAFYLAAALAYLHFSEKRRASAYAGALVLFVLALLSKTVTATLPAALLVVLWWQYGRLEWRRDVVPLIPFFGVGIAAGLATAWVEHHMIGARGAGFDFTLAERSVIAGRAIWFYLGKLFWPAHLAFVYPRWPVQQASAWQYLYPIAAAGLVAGVWLLRRWSRAPLAGVLFFCGTLFPVLGFFNVFPFRYSFVADHFVYLASIGIIVLVCGAVASTAERRGIRPAVGLALAVPLLFVARAQSHHYVDAETLYRSTIERNRSAWMAHNNLGVLQLATRPQEAEAHFREALRLNRDYAEAHNNLGYSLQAAGRLDEAISEHKEALRLEPDYAEARNNVGTALERAGRLAEAAAHYEKAVALRPQFIEARMNLGNAWVVMGRLDEAIAQHREAVRLRPDLPEAHNGLGRALAARGQIEDAISAYARALRLDGSFEDARTSLAAARRTLADGLYQSGRFEEAVAQYKESLALEGNSVETHNNLGAALERLGRLDLAIAEYEHTLRLAPSSPAVLANLARARALGDSDGSPTKR